MRGQQRTPAHERGGLGTCHAVATCVRDPARGEPPGGSRRSSNEPGCGPTSGAVHSTPAGRSKVSATKLLLRDHARPQLQESEVVGSKMWHAHGARVPPRHAGLGPLRPGVVGLDAGPLASGVARADIRDPGRNAGSNAAVGTFVHSLCAGKCAHAVVGDWCGGGAWDYHDGNPREGRSPKGQPGGNALSFSSGASPHREADGPGQVSYRE